MEQALRGDLGWHAAMLLDETRVTWFARAISAAVRPGDVVLDLGSGTGLLALLAARAGARHVYAIEQSPIADVAQEMIAANGLNERITLLRGVSYEVELPERADVIMSETLGAWGADEGIATIMADAMARLATPGARRVPQSLTLWLAPLCIPAHPPAPPHLEALGLDVSPFLARLRPPSGEGAQATILPSILAAPAQTVLTLELGHAAPARHAVALDFALSGGMEANALGGWFSATAAGVEPLVTDPHHPRTMWGQLLIPLPAPIPRAVRVAVDLSFGQDDMGVEMHAAPWQT